MNKLIFILLSVTLLNVNTLFSQDTKTITVEGSKTYNLSPNEVVIQVQYEEYFIENEKVTIESIEEQILDVLNSEKIESDKITFGAISLIRPYDYNTKVYGKPRLQKSLFVCISTSEEFASLTRALEKEKLFDTIIKTYGVSEFRHTEKRAYLEKSRDQAFLDARSKADLILSNSSQKTGKIIKIQEKAPKSNASHYESAYGVDNFQKSENSGFKPIVISYSIVVVFEILDK